MVRSFLQPLCGGLVALLGACGTTPAETPEPATADSAPAVNVPEPAATTPPTDAPPAAPPSSRPVAEERGEPTVSGELHLSKGNPVVGGRFLSRDDLVRFLGEDWREQVGRGLRVWGTLDTYVCPPQAQCLISGSIPQLKDATHMEWAPAETPEQCLAKCEEESRSCDQGARSASASRKASPRGRLRRCGSLRVSCRARCKKK